MIIFKKIRYKNFLSSGNVFTEIQLNKNDQTLIIGKNGAGKSTIIDAMFFALYNETYRDIVKSQIVNSINKKNMMIEFEFSIHSDEYLIRRGIKPDVFEIFKNDNLLNQDGNARDYQEMLETQILKMNKKTFRQIVVIGKTDYIPFMKLPTPKRREFIENLLDIQVFSTMNTILKSDININKNALSNVDKDITIIKEKIRLQEQHLEKLNKNKKDIIDNLNENIEQCMKAIDDCNINIEKIQNQINEEQNDLLDEKQLYNKINEIKNIDSKLREKASKLEKEIKFYTDNDTCPTCKQSIDHGFKCEIIDSKNTNLTELNESFEQLTKKQNSLNNKYELTTKKLKVISELQNNLRNLNSEISMQNKMILRYNEEMKKTVEQDESNTEKVDMLVSNNKLKELESLKQQLVDEKSVNDIVSVLLKDTGIKSKMIKKYIPKINTEINKYLNILDLYVNFEINENFEETIKSRHMDEFTYSSFSEGEKQRIDLALLFTWRSITKMRSGNTTNLLFFDETLDGSLDEEGINNFVKIINGLTENTNVFIISHNTDTIDRFDNVIKFEKRKNFSQIV